MLHPPVRLRRQRVKGQYVDNPHSQLYVLANVDAAAGGLIEGNSRRTTGNGEA